MPNERDLKGHELKRERDRRYRMKESNDADYKKRRIDAVKKCVEKKKEKESNRDPRMRRKYERERKRHFRNMKKFLNSTVLNDTTQAIRFNISKSEAAATRERKKTKLQMSKLVQRMRYYREKYRE